MEPGFTQLTINISKESQEAVMALLAELGYSAFEETEGALLAYIEKPLFDEQAMRNTLAIFSLPRESIQTAFIPYTNWNATWEASYAPVQIDNFCQVITSFQKPQEDFRYTLIIDPKMSFGTGHHETTRLMMRSLEPMDLRHKTVLDIGCGTAVLALLTLKMGAKEAVACDIDPWCIENGKENAKLNGAENLSLHLGTIAKVPQGSFDLILANINRNVLLEELEIYRGYLGDEGNMILSGFYNEDRDLIKKKCESIGLTHTSSLEENNWMAMVFSPRHS